MYYVKKKMEIAGCHRLNLPYESKCTNLHGHNWVVTVYCKAKELDANGMVVDFKHIKDRIHDYLDHGNFNELLPFNPPAENIAHWICGQVLHWYWQQCLRKAFPPWMISVISREATKTSI